MLRDLLERLPEKYRVSGDTGVRIGPFLPSLVDVQNKVAIEVVSKTVSVVYISFTVILVFL